ncbi:L-seryl-tRNA(Sec) selenium transferase [Campylobacter corcagiensis]|uniref:L-seryl-tRNA(Sec) selenium transferase n=1 Tax=Campylobacter corcagiensis TaxID=1448857 RepID=A0A7M1LHY0_9BACT|nr:L-seryl-tRNA(Sec) selenium transferase [Campylobacter corcagiensis]QKF65373.1 selenocysteine synthase [Campylobacter corcagiensis]QOQ88050.1 L-seryl-tRNA(Sec) selenium transferase [Campylobacter corcagiensis]
MRLPKVDKVANKDEFKGLFYPLILRLTKVVIEEQRAKMLENLDSFDENSIEDIVVNEILKRYKNYQNLELKPLINATGVVLHTNLGRAPIHPEILRRASTTIQSYSNLEYDLQSGKRGQRYEYTSLLAKELFGRDAIVVNNNASAVFLILNTFAKNKEVVLSRGELVEIGGSFRIPEVMSSSGAILKEVGTTNKTNLNDYENAINEQTSMLMKVHKSNFSIQGFSQSVNLDGIVNLAKEKQILDYYDLGSAYINPLPYALGKDEPPLSKVLKTGISLVSFSGDKLFGSVQCGIIVGKKSLLDKLRKNQLFRMLRVDKVTLSILNETIKAYINKEFDLITATSQIYKDTDALLGLANALQEKVKFDTKVIQTKTVVGGGTLPNKEYPSIALAFKGDSEWFELKFRQNGVIGRIENGSFLLDFRSVLDKDLDSLKEICERIYNE